MIKCSGATYEFGDSPCRFRMERVVYLARYSAWTASWITKGRKGCLAGCRWLTVRRTRYSLSPANVRKRFVDRIIRSVTRRPLDRGCARILTSWIAAALLPAVGLAWELLTVGGELGPDSGLLLESGKVSIRRAAVSVARVCLQRAARDRDSEFEKASS